MKMTAILRFSMMAFVVMTAVAVGNFAQTPNRKKGDAAKPVSTTETPDTPTQAEKLAAEIGDGPVADEILPYYANYLKEYRLGPNDVISVEVFGQCPDYCAISKPIPPNAKISYPLIREGIFVGGKTVEQVAAEITKRLDEFIIDPKVNVTLDKAVSTRYSVMGNVAEPGVRIMDRKVSVYEAILESGGVTKNGDKSKVAVVSYTKDGRLSKKVVSLKDMENGKVAMVYLNPGDQVFVAGKGFSIDKVFDALGKASMVRLLFGSPF